MKTCNFWGTGGIVACTLILLFVSCKPPVIINDNPNNKDSTVVLPPKVRPDGFTSTVFAFRLFAPDSTDLFTPNTGSKYNYDENENRIWIWHLAEKIYTGSQEDTLIRFYHPNLNNPKWISFGLFRDMYLPFYYYDCTDGDFNVMVIGLINYGRLRAEHSTMYIEWAPNDFDTIYTTFRKQVEGTPEFPYGYYTLDSVWYNQKLVYTWEQSIEDWCYVPIIIKEPR